MSEQNAIDFNSQAVSPNTLVSIDDDPGKYEVQIGEEGQYVEPKDIPQDTVDVPPEPDRRERTALVSRYHTLMQAWGPYQVAWEDDNRSSLIIATSTNGVHFADSPHNLAAVGIASGIGLGHVFPNQVYT